MELNTQFTYEQVVEIIRQMPEEERQRLKNDVFNQEQSIDKQQIDSIMDKYHNKYENVYKTLA